MKTRKTLLAALTGALAVFIHAFAGFTNHSLRGLVAGLLGQVDRPLSPLDRFVEAVVAARGAREQCRARRDRKLGGHQVTGGQWLLVVVGASTVRLSCLKTPAAARASFDILARFISFHFTAGRSLACATGCRR